MQESVGDVALAFLAYAGAPEAERVDGHPNCLNQYKCEAQPDDGNSLPISLRVNSLHLFEHFTGSVEVTVTRKFKDWTAPQLVESLALRGLRVRHILAVQVHVLQNVKDS